MKEKNYRKKNKDRNLTKNKEKLVFSLVDQNEQIFIVSSRFRHILEQYETNGRWVTKKTGKVIDGYFLSVRNGNDGIRSFNDYDPNFLPFLCEECALRPHWYMVQQFDICVDDSEKILIKLFSSIRRKRINIYGKHLVCLDFDNQPFKKPVKDVGVIEKEIQITTDSTLKTETSKTEKSRIPSEQVSSFYVWNYKRSDITVCFYDKQNQMYEKKDSKSFFHSRIEVRFFTKNKNEPTWIPSGDKMIRVLKEPETMSDYKTTLENKISPELLSRLLREDNESIGLRSLVFLVGLLNTFTVHRTVKNRSMLSNFFAETILLPQLFFVHFFFFKVEIFKTEEEKNLLKPFFGINPTIPKYKTFNAINYDARKQQKTYSSVLPEDITMTEKNPYGTYSEVENDEDLLTLWLEARKFYLGAVEPPQEWDDIDPFWLHEWALNNLAPDEYANYIESGKPSQLHLNEEKEVLEEPSRKRWKFFNFKLKNPESKKVVELLYEDLILFFEVFLKEENYKDTNTENVFLDQFLENAFEIKTSSGVQARYETYRHHEKPNTIIWNKIKYILFQRKNYFFGPEKPKNLQGFKKFFTKKELEQIQDFKIPVSDLVVTK